MLSNQERIERIGKLKSLPADLRKSLEGLSEKQIDTPYRDNGWTVRQVVHHLADAHMNVFLRMKFILTEDFPTLKTYNPDDWALLQDGSKMPLEASLQIIEGVHFRLSYLLESLTDSQLNRKGNHPERGPISVDDLLVMVSKHCDTHLRHINDSS